MIAAYNIINYFPQVDSILSFRLENFSFWLRLQSLVRFLTYWFNLCLKKSKTKDGTYKSTCSREQNIVTQEIFTWTFSAMILKDSLRMLNLLMWSMMWVFNSL